MICLYYLGYYLYPWSTLRKAHSYFFWPKKTNQSLQESAQVKYHVLDRDIQTDKLDRVMVVPSATLSQLDNVVYYRVPPFPFFFLPRVPRGHPLTLRVYCLKQQHFKRDSICTGFHGGHQVVRASPSAVDKGLPSPRAILTHPPASFFPTMKVV